MPPSQLPDYAPEAATRIREPSTAPPPSDPPMSLNTNALASLGAPATALNPSASMLHGLGPGLPLNLGTEELATEADLGSSPVSNAETSLTGEFEDAQTLDDPPDLADATSRGGAAALAQRANARTSLASAQH